MRRFIVRPCTVALEAIGWEAPRPSLSIAEAGNPRIFCIANATRCALAFDNDKLVPVKALIAAGQRRVVRVADEPDRHALLVPQVVERLLDLFGESVGNGNVLVLVPQWHDEVLDARPRRLAFLVSHLADVLHSADLDALEVIGPIRVERPFLHCLVAGQMPLDRFARLGRVDLADAHRGRHDQESDNQQ